MFFGLTKSSENPFKKLYSTKFTPVRKSFMRLLKAMMFLGSFGLKTKQIDIIIWKNKICVCYALFHNSCFFPNIFSTRLTLQWFKCIFTCRITSIKLAVSHLWTKMIQDKTVYRKTFLKKHLIFRAFTGIYKDIRHIMQNRSCSS